MTIKSVQSFLLSDHVLWKKILEFLNKEEMINFSCCSKNINRNLNNYFKEIISENLNKLKKESEIIDFKFNYSNASLYTLKMLNEPNFFQVFKNNEAFIPEVLIVYRLLFQLAHICDYNHLFSNEEFDLKVKTYFLKNKEKNLGIYF